MLILILLHGTVYNLTSCFDGNMQMSLTFIFPPKANDGGGEDAFTLHWFDVGQKWIKDIHRLCPAFEAG